MRNRIFGVIGVVWGGFVLLNSLAGGNPPSDDTAFRTGQNLAVGFGALLFVAGLYYLIKGDGGEPKKRRKKKAKNPIQTPL